MEELLQQIEKRVEEIQLTSSFSEEVDEFFSEAVSKTLAFQISVRPFKKILKQVGIDGVKNFIEIVRHVLKFPAYDSLSQILQNIDLVWARPKNVFAKSFLDINIYN